MNTIFRPVSGMLVAVMLISVSACDNATENSKNILLSTGSKVGKEAVQGSIAEFSKAIHNDPESAKAYAGRGTVKFAIGDKPGAILDFTKAIELDPGSAGSFTGRGTAKFSSGDIPGAVGDFANAAMVMVTAMFSKTEEKSAP
ncbi:MAG TPA: hypothetical protein VN367_00650 [Chlorobaculum sp.]|nr:hypothetical protein [Chlorobaculum sp.]